MLDAFIDCYVEKKYSSLLIAGKASEEELSQAWEVIQAEYFDETATEGQKSVSGLIKNLYLKQIEYQKVSVALEILNVCYVHTAAEELREMFGVKLDIDLPETYSQELKRVAKKMKPVLLRILQLENQLGQIKSNRSEGTISRGYFDDILITLSKVQGYHISPSQITTGMFVKLIQRISNGR